MVKNGYIKYFNNCCIKYYNNCKPITNTSKYKFDEVFTETHECSVCKRKLYIDFSKSDIFENQIKVGMN